MLRERRGQGFLCKVYRETKPLDEALSVLCVPFLSVCFLRRVFLVLSVCSRKGQLPKGLEKETIRDEMESKAQITNTHQTWKVQVQIHASDNSGEGKNMKHCPGHSF